MGKKYFVYIMTNWNDRVLYTGVTNDIVRRVHEHRMGLVDGFTKKYNVYKLVYIEEFADVRDAIAREKQIKGYSRKKKMMLVGRDNEEWRDLLG